MNVRTVMGRIPSVVGICRCETPCDEREHPTVRAWRLARSWWISWALRDERIATVRRWWSAQAPTVDHCAVACSRLACCRLGSAGRPAGFSGGARVGHWTACGAPSEPFGVFGRAVAGDELHAWIDPEPRGQSGRCAMGQQPIGLWCSKSTRSAVVVSFVEGPLVHPQDA